MAADLFIMPGTLKERCYQEPYNEKSLLLHLGLSWFDDVKAMIEEDVISSSNIKKLYSMVLSKEVPDIDQLNHFKPNKEFIFSQKLMTEAVKRSGIMGDNPQFLDPKGPPGSKEASLEQRHEDLIKDREELLAFLKYAIDNRYEVWASI
jgi:hypothetical protein